MSREIVDLRCPNCSRLQFRLAPSRDVYVEIRCRGCKQEMVVHGLRLIVLAPTGPVIALDYLPSHVNIPAS